MKTDEEIKKENPELYKVAREGGTEAPFSSKFLHIETDGAFTCAVCGQKLFDASGKFDSGTGWPSFDKAVSGSVIEHEDISHGMYRTEVLCSKCKSHLGHVFNDGPTDTGKRYCMNGVCLDLDNK
jgi:peptide-methionine (R)-S-oxide reductase